MNQRGSYKYKKRQRGFTMNELLVVISIIAILAGMLIVVSGKAIKRALAVKEKVEHRHDKYK